MKADKRTILVVDGSQHDYETYARYLGKAGGKHYQTRFLPRGQELFSATTEHPDCLLLDLSLPDMDGLEIITALKDKNSQVLPFPVVMVTGSGHRHMGEKAVSLGAQDFLIKEEVTVQSLPRAIEFAITRFALEKELRASEARYKHLAANMKMAADASGIGFWSWNSVTGMVNSDENNRKTLGIPLVGEVTYEDFLGAVHEDDRNSLRAAVERCFSTGKNYDEEFRTSQADGSSHWVAARGSVVKDANGEATGMTGMAIDITERKQAQEELKRSQSRLSMALAAAEMSTWDWDLASDSIAWSEKLEPQLAMEPGSFQGGYESFLDLVHPDDRERVDDAVKRAVGEGAEYRLEFRMTRTDGTVRWTETRGLVRRDTNGKPVRFLGVDMDITDRKQAEQTLQLALDAAQAGTWESTPATGEFKASDRALALHGVPKGTPMNHELALSVVHVDDRAAVESALRQTLESGVPFRVEMRSPQPDGSIRWLASHAVLRDDAAHKRLSGLVQDVTDRKRAEESLQKAHDVLDLRVKQRTQELNLILSELEREIEVRKTAESRMRELSVSLLRLQDEERRKIARDLHDTTGQTLTALKMTAAELQTQLQKSGRVAEETFEQLNSLADQALQEIRTTSYVLHPPLLDEAGFCSAARWYADGFSKRSRIAVDMDLDEPAERPAISVETVLFRVLQESLTNILRHTKSSMAKVRLRQASKVLVLSIKDYGAGIEPERLKRFDATGSGMGVGLAGMRERVHELGGKLCIESDATGTCVTASISSEKQPSYGSA